MTGCTERCTAKILQAGAYVVRLINWLGTAIVWRSQPSRETFKIGCLYSVRFALKSGLKIILSKLT